MKTGSVILAPKGFPWHAAAVWVAVVAVGMLVGLNLMGAHSVGGVFVIAALFGNAAFAAALGH